MAESHPTRARAHASACPHVLSTDEDVDRLVVASQRLLGVDVLERLGCVLVLHAGVVSLLQLLGVDRRTLHVRLTSLLPASAHKHATSSRRNAQPTMSTRGLGARAGCCSTRHVCCPHRCLHFLCPLTSSCSSCTAQPPSRASRWRPHTCATRRFTPTAAAAAGGVSIAVAGAEAARQASSALAVDDCARCWIDDDDGRMAMARAQRIRHHHPPDAHVRCDRQGIIITSRHRHHHHHQRACFH